MFMEGRKMAFIKKDRTEKLDLRKESVVCVGSRERISVVLWWRVFAVQP